MKNNTKKILAFIFLMLTIFLQFFLLTVLFTIIQPSEKRNEENILMDYTMSGGFDYKVYLRPNEFIDEEFLPSGDAYLMDLIDHINLIYNYGFKSSLKTKVSGENKLKLKLIVYYKEYSSQTNKTEVLNNEVVLKEQELYFNNNIYNYENNYDLYLDEYLKILDEFNKKIKISTEGYLEITSETKFSGSIFETRYFDKYENKLRIPLSSSVVKIENNNEKDKESFVYKKILEEPNKTLIIYTLITNVIVFFINCFLIKKIFFNIELNKYEEEIKKILRLYDDIIVNVSNNIDINDYNIVEISEFKEMLNLSRELLLPIMNFEYLKNEETWFYIIKDNILYRYKVKNKN